jgi:hypothetical protein
MQRRSESPAPPYRDATRNRCPTLNEAPARRLWMPDLAEPGPNVRESETSLPTGRAYPRRPRTPAPRGRRVSVADGHRPADASRASLRERRANTVADAADSLRTGRDEALLLAITGRSSTFSEVAIKLVCGLGGGRTTTGAPLARNARPRRSVAVSKARRSRGPALRSRRCRRTCRRTD